LNFAEALRANIGSKSALSLQRGLGDPKFQVDVVAPSNHCSYQKTRLNHLSYGIKIWTDLSSVLSQSTCLTDGQTDKRTAFSSLDCVCIACSVAKMLLSSIQHRLSSVTVIMKQTSKTEKRLQCRANDSSRTHRQTYRQTGRQTDRWRGKHAKRLMN